MGSSILSPSRQVFESRWVYRKCASPNRVPDAATPKRKLDSKNLLYVRVSGAKRDSLPLKRYTSFATAKLALIMIESRWVYRKCA
ncbi:hypothetical protein, partial [uncultured Helicobacter sp.]|uniref:hypothetical protein n=1 Tax=uncultured Helicobacter sp. TaxID=175537 RepID=UPI00374E7440